MAKHILTVESLKIDRGETFSIFRDAPTRNLFTGPQRSRTRALLDFALTTAPPLDIPATRLGVIYPRQVELSSGAPKIIDRFAAHVPTTVATSDKQVQCHFNYTSKVAAA